jgi:nucleotide-binding universal stress UspA family protein
MLNRIEPGARLYQKILVPIDGSGHSKRALQEAIKIAKMTNGSITLLNINTRSITQYAPNQPNNEGAQNSVLIDGQRLVQAEGIPADTRLLEGKVVDQIVKTAKEENFDLIVIGARGLNKFEEILLGSVSHGVVEAAPCPVIVTR